MKKTVVEVNQENLRNWANSKPQWQTIVTSVIYKNMAKAEWEKLLDRQWQCLALWKPSDETRFYSRLNDAMAEAFAGELLDKLLAGVEDWENTTVDERWLKETMHRKRQKIENTIPCA